MVMEVAAVAVAQVPVVQRVPPVAVAPTVLVVIQLSKEPHSVIV